MGGLGGGVVGGGGGGGGVGGGGGGVRKYLGRRLRGTRTRGKGRGRTLRLGKVLGK